LIYFFFTLFNLFFETPTQRNSNLRKFLPLQASSL